jgi:hypothetical protein
MAIKHLEEREGQRKLSTPELKTQSNDCLQDVAGHNVENSHIMSMRCLKFMFRLC